MLTDKAAVTTYFAKLGLDAEIADIYLSLHSHGPQTISELSRSSRVERTRIYRLVDKLLASNLIEVESHYKRGVIKAAPIANLHILINEKEQELKSLQDELGLIEQVLARNSLSSAATRIQFYQGREGIRQMLWNELEAKSEILGYNYRILDEGTNKKIMGRWTEEFEKRKLQSRIITSNDFSTNQHDGQPPLGEVIGLRVKGINYRYIALSDFTITHSCYIYDSVVAYYHWKDNEIFGIEIYNLEIAGAQRQFFEIIWEKSKTELF
jgi:sugar-specific transcriptional regulator TrmB